MFQDGRAGQVGLNICYFTGPDGLSDTELTTRYREWLAFDAFVLHDHYPIQFYDENETGRVESVPAGVPRSSNLLADYKQIDYDRIAPVMLRAEGLANEGVSSLSYADLFAAYERLHFELKDMIEWYVSVPHSYFTRPNAFFSVNYWQLVHTMILLERLIGLPPDCPHHFEKCPACGSSPQSHYRLPRREWRKQFLATQIKDFEVEEEYAQLIDAGVSVRNKIAHVPYFDRSTYPELFPGERQAYEINRAVTEHDCDRVALHSLLISLREVARYLLLDRAFGTKYFGRLRSLNVICIGSSKTSDVGSGKIAL